MAEAIQLSLDLHLANENNQAELKLSEDPAGQALRFEVINTTDRAINFNELSGNISPARCHLILAFRPGILMLEKPEITQDNERFDFFVSTDDSGNFIARDDGTVRLFFKAKPGMRVRLQPTEKLTFNLDKLKIDPGDGTRWTRVQLLYRALSFAGGNRLLPEPQFREMHLKIVE